MPSVSEDPAFPAFWRERRYATLTTSRPDGTPHVVPVSVTYEPETRTARVLATRDSRKVRNIAAATAAAAAAGRVTAAEAAETAEAAGTSAAPGTAGPPGARVALCQVDGRRWATLEGRAVIRTEGEPIADAERRYEVRYGRRPRENPERVLIEITVDRTMGRV